MITEHSLSPPDQTEEAIDLPEPLRPTRRRLPTWAIVLGVLGLILMGLIGLRLLRGPRATREQSLTALTQPVETSPLTVRVEGTGSVVAQDTVNLSPKIAGRLESLYGEQGDPVQAGEILAQMEVGTLTDELRQGQAQLAQAEADYAKALAGNRSEDIRR